MLLRGVYLGRAVCEFLFSNTSGYLVIIIMMKLSPVIPANIPLFSTCC